MRVDEEKLQRVIEQYAREQARKKREVSALISREIDTNTRDLKSYARRNKIKDIHIN